MQRQQTDQHETHRVSYRLKCMRQDGPRTGVQFKHMSSAAGWVFRGRHEHDFLGRAFEEMFDQARVKKARLELEQVAVEVVSPQLMF